mgnify:CR=1 FL=1
MKRLDEILRERVSENGQELLAESRQLGEAENSFMLAERLPFRMFCETEYGNKEGYQEMIRQFRQVKDNDYDRMIKGTCQGKAEESLELAYFFTACADTLEVTSMEIYEHYRYLADLMRKTMLQLRKNGFFKEASRKNLDKKTEMILGKAILKGCELKVLLQEKYEKIGQDLIKN